MTENRQDFRFDAPQFYDFSNGEYVEESPEKVEEYFNVDHECEKVIEVHETYIQESMEYQEFYTPMSHPSDRIEYHVEAPEMPPLRRSMSVGNIMPRQQYKNEDDNLVGKMDDLSVQCKVSSAQKERKSRLTENLNRLAQPKRLYSSTESLQNAERFVSMAELVSKFQRGTPVRFRSKPAANLGVRPPPTKAHSPALATRARARPVHVLSREDREKLELEEAKKFKIRANPINKKVMQGPVKAVNCVPKQPPTVPEPFKITSYPKKAPTPEPMEKYEFHAKPVPRSVLEPLKPTRLSYKVTVPQAPSFMKHYNRVTPKKDVDVPDRRCSSAQKAMGAGARPTTTKLAPFSFEKRDQDMLKRREELVRKVIEEEKKVREFHAKPIPKSLYRPPSRDNSTAGTSRQTSFASTKSDDAAQSVGQFRARPATVLHTKPFKPKKDDRPLTEIAAFDLNTDRRVHERAEFEQRQREKEEMIEALKRAEEEMQRRREAEEAARAREDTKFKANPVKKYKEVRVKPVGKCTVPISPHWHTNRLRNKENIADNH